MHLKSLRLQNFRNIQDQLFEFHPEFNFIFGKNAQGKTNLIEAIYYLSELKSFRTTNRSDLIKKNKDFASVHGVFEKDDLGWDIQLSLTESDRRVLLNKKKPKSRSEYYGLIPLVLFEPRHIYLFRDSPSQRRKFFNRALYIQNVNHLSLFRDYDKIIAQKNRLLKEGGGFDLLEVWNDRLIHLAAQIISLRLGWLDQVQDMMTSEYQAISHTGEQIVLEYHSQVPELDKQKTKLTDKDIALCLGDALQKNKHKEKERRESLIGPHRDDFSVSVGGRHVGNYGSQGENRSVIIALKLSQLKLFTKKYHKTPLFLLDDVASELDESRCRYLFDYLKKESTQVFLTTTDSTILANDFAGHATSYYIENGIVVK